MRLSAFETRSFLTKSLQPILGTEPRHVAPATKVLTSVLLYFSIGMLHIYLNSYGKGGNISPARHGTPILDVNHPTKCFPIAPSMGSKHSVFWCIPYKELWLHVIAVFRVRILLFLLTSSKSCNHQLLLLYYIEWGCYTNT